MRLQSPCIRLSHVSSDSSSIKFGSLISQVCHWWLQPCLSCLLMCLSKLHVFARKTACSLILDVQHVCTGYALLNIYSIPMSCCVSILQNNTLIILICFMNIFGSKFCAFLFEAVAQIKIQAWTLKVLNTLTMHQYSPFFLFLW